MVLGSMDRSKMLPAAERGAEACIRDGEWDCDEDFATKPPDSNFSREDSLECAM